MQSLWPFCLPCEANMALSLHGFIMLARRNAAKLTKRRNNKPRIDMLGESGEQASPRGVVSDRMEKRVWLPDVCDPQLPALSATSPSHADGFGNTALRKP